MGKRECSIFVVIFWFGFVIFIIWKCWVNVLFFLKYFLYFFYVVVVIMCNFLWVRVGLSKLVVLVCFGSFFVLIREWVLLINKIVVLFKELSLVNSDFRWFLNFFLILVFVSRVFILRVWIRIFFSILGIWLDVICSVKFFIILFFFIFGLLVSIGLFCLWWSKILISCLIFFFLLVIGFNLFVFVCRERFLVYLLRYLCEDLLVGWWEVECFVLFEKEISNFLVIFIL